MSETRTFELILSPSDSHEDDDVVLAIYEFDGPTHTGDTEFAFFSLCGFPPVGGVHADQPLAA